MMNISVKAVHFHADEKLVTYIEKKINRLTRYFDRSIDAEVHLKLQDTGGRVREKITEIKLHVPGGWMMDKKTGKTFESAINASVVTLKRQLLRHKEKLSLRGVIEE
ncbi:MAG: ribosome-associated translation inhibitor RaiA [Lewinellaceae bacterium]|nr:ribosome-associated translation inhibitor RaiA [Lewinellaceae bacterium]